MVVFTVWVSFLGDITDIISCCNGHLKFEITETFLAEFLSHKCKAAVLFYVWDTISHDFRLFCASNALVNLSHCGVPMFPTRGTSYLAMAMQHYRECVQIFCRICGMTIAFCRVKFLCSEHIQGYQDELKFCVKGDNPEFTPPNSVAVATIRSQGMVHPPILHNERGMQNKIVIRATDMIRKQRG